jgi:RecG-like helicase
MTLTMDIANSPKRRYSSAKGSSMSKTNNQKTPAANVPNAHNPTRSTQATVVSVCTKIIDADTKITYAKLKSDTETLYAAWRNSYFARDIMVHRKYTFSGKAKKTNNMTVFNNPTIIELPLVGKYFDFALAPPGQSPRPTDWWHWQ